MNWILVDLFIVVYAILILAFIRIAPKKNIHEDYLSPESSMSLRGIMAVGIILHHMSERISSGYLFPQMQHAGYLFVSSFFFLSGFGLLRQYEKRGDSYLKGFFRTRILYLLIVYVLDVLLYSFYDFVIGKPHTILEILQSIYSGGIAMNAWYMIVLIVFYLVFWAVFGLMKKCGTVTKIVMVFVFQILFIFLCILWRKNNIWYMSNLGFSLGMVWAFNQKKIDKFACDHYLKLFLSALIAFVFFSAMPLLLARVPFLSVYAKPIKIVCRIISAPLSTALLIILLQKFSVKSALWSYLGGISLEIYLLHGMVYSFFRSGIVYIENDALWILLTILVSVAISIPVSLLNKMIHRLTKKQLGVKKQ